MFTNPNVSENWLKVTGLVPHTWLERNGYELIFFKTFTSTLSFSAHSLVTPGIHTLIQPPDWWETEAKRLAH